MSIRAIPNQPVGFDDSRFTSCWNDDPAETLLVHTDDDLSFQVAYDPCDLVNLVDSPSFESEADYNFYQFVFDNNQACSNGVNPGTYINTITGFGTPGNVYLVRLSVRSLTVPGRLSGLTVSFGGVILTTDLRAAGEYEWVVTAISAAPLTVLTNTANTGVCLSYMGVYELTPDITVDLLDDTNTPVLTWDNVTDPDLFSFGSGRFTFTVPVSQMQVAYQQVTGCHRIRVTDACDNSVLTSQVVNIGEHECTLQLKVCNTSPSIGFESFEPVMRVVGKLSSPRFEYEASEERMSNGNINRPYADRRMSLELRVDGGGEYAHRFLSTLPLWDHFYIDRVEYIAKADGYEPAYGDVYDATGSVVIALEPKLDLARKVRSTADNGGCTPPPNYLVQGTGPNEDYVTQADGNLILINA